MNMKKKRGPHLSYSNRRARSFFLTTRRGRELSYNGKIYGKRCASVFVKVESCAYPASVPLKTVTRFIIKQIFNQGYDLELDVRVCMSRHLLKPGDCWLRIFVLLPGLALEWRYKGFLYSRQGEIDRSESVPTDPTERKKEIWS